MAGGGIYRGDIVQFAMAEEVTDGLTPATITGNLGLIKGGIVLPDVVFTWDPFFGVGRVGRGRKAQHEGIQSFKGSIPSIYVCHRASRPILEAWLGERSGVALVTAPSTATSDTTLTDAARNFTTLEGGATTKGGNHAIFSGISVGYIGTEVGAGVTQVTVYPTPNRTGTQGWNGPRPCECEEYEVRRTEGLDAGDFATYSVQHVVLKQRLNTIAWGARFRNNQNHGAGSVGSFLTVDYLGGKVNRASLTAKQGEKLILNLEEVLFRDLRHDSNLPAGVTSLQKYSASVVAPAAVFPTEEPIVFSNGSINLFEKGNSFARINSFTLTVDNNITEERYVARPTIAGNPVVAQVPFELIEGNRIITLEVEAVMETREYWEHLMRQGRNDALSVAKTGFDFELHFSKFDNIGTIVEWFIIRGPAHDNPVIVFNAAKPLDSVVNQSSATNVGCVLSEAPHAVPSGDGDQMITVRMMIDVPTLALTWHTVL